MRAFAAFFGAILCMAAPALSSPPLHRNGRFTYKGGCISKVELKHNKFVFGTAYSPEGVKPADMDWYQTRAVRDFWGLVPENAFKWNFYEPGPGSIARGRNITQTRYLDFARKHGISHVRGTTLDWGVYLDQCNAQFCFWPYTLSCQGYANALKTHVQREVATFKGQFKAYDVFNEVIAHPGMLGRCNLWRTTFPDAFKWAHAADPAAILTINDFGLIEGPSADKMVALVNGLREDGAPVHAIGIQAHFSGAPDLVKIKARLDILAKTGLKLYITETSIFSTWKGSTGGPQNDLDEATHAARLISLIRLCYEHPAVNGFFLWGFWDGNMWVKKAGIYRADKTPKPAATAVRALWNEYNRVIVHPGPNSVTFEGPHGCYRITNRTATVTKCF